MEIICPIWLPQAKVPIMERAFEKIKREIDEPDLEWCFHGTNCHNQTPFVYLKGVSEARKKAILEKLQERRLTSTWPIGTPFEVGKVLSETWHLRNFRGH